MSFLLKYKEEILEWLNSQEFKEKYVKTNHPYPPMLNPERLNAKVESCKDKVAESHKDKSKNQTNPMNPMNPITPYPNLSYESIPPELAWDLNLPLPRGYEILVFGLHTSGEKAFASFLRQIKFEIMGLSGSALIRYKKFYEWILQKKISPKAIVMLDSNCIKFEKLLFLMNEQPCIILTRDPIDRLKSFINVRFLEDGWHNRVFNVNYPDNNFNALNDRIIYVHSGGYFTPKLKLKYPSIVSNLQGLSDCTHMMLSYILKTNFLYNIFERNKIFHIDMNEFSGSNRTYPTMQKIAKIAHLDIENHNFFNYQLYSTLTLLLPVCIQIGEIKIYISNYFSYKSIQEIDESLEFTSEFEFAKDKVFDKNLRIFAKKQDYLKLKSDKNYGVIKSYILDFLKSLKERILREESKMITSQQVLQYLKNNQEIRFKFKNLFDKELSHIKQMRPDIVESWKYYQEFERMCKELD